MRRNYREAFENARAALKDQLADVQVLRTDVARLQGETLYAKRQLADAKAAKDRAVTDYMRESALRLEEIRQKQAVEVKLAEARADLLRVTEECRRLRQFRDIAINAARQIDIAGGLVP